jgi:hypothetical protein
VLAIDRMLTFGMDPDLRESMLAEQAADWEAMFEDERYGGGWRVAVRQLKGIPLALWWRLTRREVTGIPLAIGMTILAVATLFETSIPGYPLDHRLALMVLSLALAAGVWPLMRRPRQIVVTEWRPFAVLLGLAAVSAILTLPISDGWSRFDPEQTVLPACGLIGRIGMGIAVVGCVILFLASFTEKRRAGALVSGALIVVGALLVAATEIVWAVWMAPLDMSVTFIFLGMGFGTVLGAHMLFRLRNLEIV